MWGKELSWRKDVQWLSSSKPWQTIRGGEAIVGRHTPLSLCTQANTHNLLPSSIHPHTPAFKLQQRAACHCHIFFPKSQLKTPNVCVCASVCGCFGKNFDWQTLSGGPEGLRSHCKRFIGKMHPRMHLGGSCPGAIIEWPLRAWLQLTFPPVNKLTFLSSEEVDPFSSHIYTVGFRHSVRSKTEEESLMGGVWLHRKNWRWWCWRIVNSFLSVQPGFISYI